ncbi:LysE/ArgO family amino acid transporter [Gynuella sunshinyii]|uniref:Lysine efflux permease n=1 Tax=Gynuella sunshinyii YC6258 TaxID=1445510 RepID=A0A0C5VGU7_9GAMM|nr:LysE/ArgO family amino acid transporter [Gynuella sunshinyii]AJQ93812.1 lysine efflux permease [Gynuella sunshinyii YC6258]
MDFVTVFLKGFMTGGSLIVAIGAQNAFVLTQGVRRQYIGTIAVTCTLLDMGLIFSGITGLGVLISSNQRLLLIASAGGALFLTVYGARSLRTAMTSQQMKRSEISLQSHSGAIAVTLGLSLLNPHVYLDTVLLIGSIGGQFETPARYWFGFGAASASAVWFFMLAYGAARLSPLFSQPIAWKVLDVVIAAVMWSIAGTLWYQAWLYFQQV